MINIFLIRGSGVNAANLPFSELLCSEVVIFHSVSAI
jgi:hypothetical protein